MENIKDAEYEIISTKEIKTVDYPCFVLPMTNGKKLFIPFEDVKEIKLFGLYNINGQDVNIYKMVFTNNTFWQLPIEEEQIKYFKEKQNKK